MTKKNKVVTSNTDECFTTFLGQKVIGFYVHDGGRILVFDDGRGLHVHHNGAYWVVSEEELSRELDKVRADLQRRQRETRDVLHLAGALAEKGSR